jgi:hypothetical protein
MERLFSPCNRLRDQIESEGRHKEYNDQDDIESLQELNLNISTEELLSAERAFTYVDLYAMLGNGDTVLRLTPHAFSIQRTCGIANTTYISEFVGDDCNADGKAICAVAGSSEELLEICDVVLQLLAASAVRTVELSSWRCPGNVSFNATSFAYLIRV